MSATNGNALSHWASRLNALGEAGTPCFFLVDFERAKPRAWTLPGAAAAGLRFDFPERPDPASPPPGPNELPQLEADHLPATTYRRAFATVQAALRRGDSFLTNLTFPVPVRLTTDLAGIYAATEAKYRLLVPGAFVCFSPETFVTVDAAGYVESRPMKGTAPDTPAGRRELLESPKEIAEHATIVDLIRNDLSQVARRVRVTDYRYLRPISSSRRGLVQTSSKVGGQLPDDWRRHLGTTLLRLLPAGSVSGAPKPATLEIIRRAELDDRGYYCGVAGYFDGRTLDSCVLIRFIERTASGTYNFRSGGGITARSRWAEEYAELRGKIRLPLRAPDLNTFSLL